LTEQSNLVRGIGFSRAPTSLVRGRAQFFPRRHAAVAPKLLSLPPIAASARQRLGTQGKVHVLLATYPMPRLEQVYVLVFERILNQRLSTIPVVNKG
jgi:hypothetical protein